MVFVAKIVILVAFLCGQGYKLTHIVWLHAIFRIILKESCFSYTGVYVFCLGIRALDMDWLNYYISAFVKLKFRF
jgi:hypothetical protein